MCVCVCVFVYVCVERETANESESARYIRTHCRRALYELKLLLLHLDHLQAPCVCLCVSEEGRGEGGTDFPNLATADLRAKQDPDSVAAAFCYPFCYFFIFIFGMHATELPASSFFVKLRWV